LESLEQGVEPTSPESGRTRRARRSAPRLNKEFEEARGGGLKYLFVVLLFALIVALSQMIDLERSLG
jgi:hypothetical protein